MRKLLPLLAALLLLVAGCGDEESTGSGTGGGSPEEPAASGGGDAVVVKMKDILFVPDKVTVRVGQAVRWLNEDDVAHTVKAPSFESEKLRRGDVFEAEFSKPAKIDYVCSIHPSQKGTITVVAR
jgi:plastocyanin